MTAPEREALVKRIRPSELRAQADAMRNCNPLPRIHRDTEDEIYAAAIALDIAADMIEALSPAVTVTDEMLSRACEAYKGERHMVDRGAMMAALQAALKSTAPQTAGREE